MSGPDSQFVFTVDVEDWFQVENLRSACPRSRWDGFERRVEDRTRELLDLCDAHGVKATFFILGWVAERHPRLVRDIAATGHEVACHGYNHELLTRMDEAEIRADISRAKSLLEDQTGSAIQGYRAPSFSITDRAVEILADLGFAYDSSLFPFQRHGRYGRLSGEDFDRLDDHVYRHRDSGLYEFLLPMRRIGPLSAPWAGGGYFRLLPYRIYSHGVRAHLADQEPFIFYVHPWEIDPGQPRVRTIKTSHRLRHYINLHRSFERLDALLAAFGGTTRLADLAGAMEARH